MHFSALWLKIWPLAAALQVIKGIRQMRAILALATINSVVWGAFVAFAPGSHFALPGSYNYWWFDDVPWLVLIIAVFVPILLLALRLKGVGGFKSGSIVVLAVTLLAVLPYAACSGGGV